MAISYPRDLPGCPQRTPFELVRFQSRNLTGGGPTDAIDIAPPLWRGPFRYRTVDRELARALSAWVASMRGGLRSFKGVPPGHRFPVKHPRGFTGWDGVGAIKTIAVGRDSATFDGVQNGMTISPGDYFSVVAGSRQHLHKVLEGGVAASGEITLTFEPGLKPNVVVDAVTRFADPYCEMHIEAEPQEDIDGAVYSLSFTGMQVAI